MYLAGNLFLSNALEVNHIPEDWKALVGLVPALCCVLCVLQSAGVLVRACERLVGAEKQCPDAFLYEDIKRVSRGHVGRDHVRPSSERPWAASRLHVLQGNKCDLLT